MKISQKYQPKSESYISEILYSVQKMISVSEIPQALDDTESEKEKGR